MMSSREAILDMIRAKDRPAGELEKTGLSRTTIQTHLRSLIADGEVFAFGRGRAIVYSTNPNYKRPPPEKRQTYAIPDLPPIMLLWGGYNAVEPDPDAGEFIHGGQWS